jgi:DNA-directed RNA polymerase subunit RPC12/RpoP
MKEPQPGEWYYGCECAKCGEPIRPDDRYKTGEGWDLTCENCQHKQVYPITEMTRRQHVARSGESK